MGRAGRGRVAPRRVLLLVPAALVLALLALIGVMRTDGSGTSAISVTEAWARPATAGAMPGMDHGIAGTMASGTSSVAYLTIVNSGDGGDTLIAVATASAGAVELHQTTIKDSVASMRQVREIAVPKRGVVRFNPGGYHLVLVNVRRDLRPGDTITLTLTFARAGTIEVTVPVRDA